METLLPSRPLKEKAECHLRAEEQPEETGGGSAVVLWAGPTGSAPEQRFRPLSRQAQTFRSVSRGCTIDT